jgi:hypothetical protein
VEHLPSRCVGMDVRLQSRLLPQSNCRKTAELTLLSALHLVLLIVNATTHLSILPISMLLDAWCTILLRFHKASRSSTYASYPPSLPRLGIKWIKEFWPLTSPCLSPRFWV